MPQGRPLTVAVAWLLPSPDCHCGWPMDVVASTEPATAQHYDLPPPSQCALLDLGLLGPGTSGVECLQCTGFCMRLHVECACHHGAWAATAQTLERARGRSRYSRTLMGPCWWILVDTQARPHSVRRVRPRDPPVCGKQSLRIRLCAFALAALHRRALHPKRVRCELPVIVARCVSVCVCRVWRGAHASWRSMPCRHFHSCGRLHGCTAQSPGRCLRQAPSRHVPYL